MVVVDVVEVVVVSFAVVALAVVAVSLGLDVLVFSVTVFSISALVSAEDEVVVVVGVWVAISLVVSVVIFADVEVPVVVVVDVVVGVVVVVDVGVAIVVIVVVDVAAVVVMVVDAVVVVVMVVVLVVSAVVVMVVVFVVELRVLRLSFAEARGVHVASWRLAARARACCASSSCRVTGNATCVAWRMANATTFASAVSRPHGRVEATRAPKAAAWACMALRHCRAPTFCGATPSEV